MIKPLAKRGQPGFTIVELLVVVVVIAILAAISVVTYTSIQQRARDTKRKDDVAKITKALALWSAGTSSSFESLNTGWNGAATGWFSSSYGGQSVKQVLVSVGYLSNDTADPLNGAVGARDYMLSRCIYSANDNRRVVFARLEQAPLDSVAVQIQSSGCTNSAIADFSSGSYGMNYAVVASGQ